MRKNQKKDSSNEPSSPAWMVTYGDMMTLILCFFVLLFSFSSIDAAKFQEVMEALRARMGILDGGRTFSPGPVIDSGMQSELYSQYHYQTNEFRNVVAQVEDYISQANLEDEVSLSEEARGLVIRMTGKILFDLGKAELKQAGIETLKEIGSFLEGIPNDINVEGHTDNWPINTPQFPDNWVLSTFRAYNVLRFLENNTDIESNRMSASGYGPHRPVVPNDTVEHRAMNRRVDIVVLRTIREDETEVGEGYNE